MDSPYEEEKVSEEDALLRPSANRTRRTTFDRDTKEERQAELIRQMEEDRAQHRNELRTKEAESKL